MTTTIALLHPGSMGAAVGACLKLLGHRVLWVSAGRSPATCKRAQAAGLEDAGTLKQALDQAGIVLSICPPHGAVDLAREVAQNGFRGIFVDANAIAPTTAREVERIVTGHGGVHFVDGGIIGTAPGKAGATRLYLSGEHAGEVAALFAGSTLEALAIPGGAGQASTLKICVAAWNKGSTALLADIRALALHSGIDEALLAEWRISAPQIEKRAGEIAERAEKAWRWVGEMEEIAATFEGAGLPGGFHLAAADIYRRLEEYKDVEGTPPVQEVLAGLLRKPA